MRNNRSGWNGTEKADETRMKINFLLARCCKPVTLFYSPTGNDGKAYFAVRIQ